MIIKQCANRGTMTVNKKKFIKFNPVLSKGSQTTISFGVEIHNKSRG
jgi:hypothetical protein